MHLIAVMYINITQRLKVLLDAYEKAKFLITYRVTFLIHTSSRYRNAFMEILSSAYSEVIQSNEDIRDISSHQTHQLEKYELLWTTLAQPLMDTAYNK